MTENLKPTTAYDIQNLSDATPKIAIIGAGLTGLMTAHLLEQAFVSQNRALNIVIFEKSAGVGRLATRYKNPENNRNQQWQFDFGAQFFTAKSQSFQDYLQPLLAQGVIESWLAKTATIVKELINYYKAKENKRTKYRYNADASLYVYA